MSMSNLTPTQRVERESLAVISHPQYRPFGGIVMLGRTTISDEVGTADTDGMNTRYNPAFVERMDEKEMRFLILHEALHKAKRDLVVWVHLWKEDARLANLACDYVNNLELVKSDTTEKFIAMPKGGALDWRFDNMDVYQVFQILKQEQEANGGGGGNMALPEGFDEHNWEEATSMAPEKMQEIKEQVKDALRQGSLLSKNMSGDFDRMVQELLYPESRWEDELREFAVSACSGKELSTWRRPSRRSIDRGIYLPSTYSEQVRRIVIAVDTSGSISGSIIKLFLGTVMDVANTVNPEMIDLLYWDAKVAGHEKYGEGEYATLMDSTKPRGGGGTRPSCVSRYLTENNIRPECIMVLTDGLVGGDWGSGWTAPVLWCITGGSSTTAANGKTIYIKERK